MKCHFFNIPLLAFSLALAACGGGDIVGSLPASSDTSTGTDTDTSTDPQGKYRLTQDKDYSQCHFKANMIQARKNQPSRPLVIKHGWDLPRMSYLKNNDGTPKQAFIDQIKERAFDGVTFSLNQVSHAISKETYSEEDAEKALSYFDGVDLGDVNENMLILYTHHPGKDYTQTGYEHIVDNLRHLARAASKRNNVKGILLDTEYYPSNTYGNIDPWDYSSDICENYTADEDGQADGFATPADKQKCDTQAYNRGYEAMQAMVEEWPDMKLLTLFGIWTDDPLTFNLVNGRWGDSSTGFAPHYEWHHNQGLMPHFLAGMFAATVCTNATFTDGTELYGLRELSDFQTTGKFITDGIVDNNPFLPDNIKEPYRAEVGLGFGVYDDHYAVFEKHDKFPLPKMTPDVWETTIKNAGKVATHYVWLYTERHDWWDKDPNPWPKLQVEEEPKWVTATNTAVKNIKSQ